MHVAPCGLDLPTGYVCDRPDGTIKTLSTLIFLAIKVVTVTVNYVECYSYDRQRPLVQLLITQFGGYGVLTLRLI